MFVYWQLKCCTIFAQLILRYNGTQIEDRKNGRQRSMEKLRDAIAVYRELN